MSQISSQLRLFDPRIKEISEQESVIEPNWLTQLRNLDGQIKVSSVFLLENIIMV